MPQLGIPRKEYYNISDTPPASEPAPDNDNSLVYPSFEVRGKAVKLAGLSAVEPGEDIEFTVKGKVVEVRRKDRADGKTEPYDNCVSIDVHEIEGVDSKADEEPEEEETETDKKLGFKAGDASKGKSISLKESKKGQY
jgi:hypothetical protein